MKKGIAILGLGLAFLLSGRATAQWFVQYTGPNPLPSIDFIDTLHGVAPGLVTTNGGANWLGAPGASGPGIRLVTPTRGFSVTNSYDFVTTTDGGFTWQMTTRLTGQYVQGLSYPDTLHGWATTTDGGLYYIFATTDGGYNWSKQDSEGGTLFGVMFVDSLHGWVCKYEGGVDTLSILATRDGGRTWVKQRTPTWGPARAVFFLDTLRGWLESNPQTLITTNGGQTWVRDSETLATQCNDIVFADEQFGWKVGENLRSAKIMVTTDGGWHWTDQAPGISDELKWVDFVGRRKGWIASRGGQILHTENGGGTWVKQRPPDPVAEPRTEIKVTPNPFRTQAKVSDYEGERFELFDISGRLVGTYKGDKVGKGLAAGVYFLRPEQGSPKPLRIVKLR